MQIRFLLWVRLNIVGRLIHSDEHESANDPAPWKREVYTMSHPSLQLLQFSIANLLLRFLIDLRHAVTGRVLAPMEARA